MPDMDDMDDMESGMHKSGKKDKESGDHHYKHDHHHGHDHHDDHHGFAPTKEVTDE